TIVRALAEPGLESFVFVLAGRTDSAEFVDRLRSLARSLKVENRVILAGQVATHDIPAVLGLAHFFVSASTSEGRPNAVLEAIAARVPVVLSDIPAHREIVTDGESGLLFRCGDVRDLARAIREFDRDGDLRLK